MKKRICTLCLVICCMMAAMGTAWAQTPTPTRTLDSIPVIWTVTANGQSVPVTPYASPNQDKGYATVPEGATVVLTPPDSIKPRVKNVTLLAPEEIPLTFEAKAAGATVKFYLYSEVVTNPVEYSTDGITWKNYKSDSAIVLTNIGDKVSFRGNNAAYAEYYEGDAASHFSCTADCYIYGNVMSLVNPVNFAAITELTSDNKFCLLFNHNSHIYNHAAKTLLLPAATLSSWCYAGMFLGCTNLTTAPVLPATAMAEFCYHHMFDSCTSLTTAPALPATTLAYECYSSMFGGCTSLETAPALPATSLDSYCYNAMFEGCTSLVTAPALPATNLVSGCYAAMFYNCTNLTTPPTLSATNLENSCYSVMFNGCTSLETAPALLATTLAGSCYYGMFSGCTSLTTAPALPATTLAAQCYSDMFSGCTGLTTAPLLPAETLAEECYYHMFDSCRNLNRVTCLATDISAPYCTTGWLNKVAATGTFYKAASASWTNGNSGVPNGWSVVHSTFDGFNSETTAHPILEISSDMSGISTITRNDGVVDLQGHTVNILYCQNNTSGDTVTIQNGKLSGGIDGNGGWDDNYYGTVRLVNMNINDVFNDGHAFVIESGTYNSVNNTVKDGTDYPGTYTIYGGYFNTFNTSVASGHHLGTYTLYGGYYKFNPSSNSQVTIASGYKVETCSGDYGWRVVPN